MNSQGTEMEWIDYNLKKTKTKVEFNLKKKARKMYVKTPLPSPLPLPRCLSQKHNVVVFHDNVINQRIKI